MCHTPLKANCQKQYRLISPFYVAEVFEICGSSNDLQNSGPSYSAEKLETKTPISFASALIVPSG